MPIYVLLQPGQATSYTTLLRDKGGSLSLLETKYESILFMTLKVENLQFQPASCFEAYLAFSRCLFFAICFLLYFLHCRLVMVF